MTTPSVGRLATIRASLRRRGIVRTIKQALYRRGIMVTRFWWVKEQLPEAFPDPQEQLPPDLAFRMLTEADLPQLLTFPSRGAPMAAEHLTNGFANGGGCLGVVRGDAIVGFGWWYLDDTHTYAYPRRMAAGEAYLHNMYVLPEERGHNLAVRLRHRTYQLLAELGCSTFYSITEVTNLPSWRFKEKLGATKVSLHWYLGIRKRWHWRVTLRRYAQPSLLTP